MNLVSGNLFLRGPLANQSMDRRAQPRGHRLHRLPGRRNLMVAERGVHLAYGVVRRHLGGTAPAGTGDVLA
jgi:hypothetical protein